MGRGDPCLSWRYGYLGVINDDGSCSERDLQGSSYQRCNDANDAVNIRTRLRRRPYGISPYD